MEKEQFLVKGLNTDNDPSLQPENTYRGLTGFNLTSTGNNSYAIESEKGNSLAFTLNPNFTPIGIDKEGTKLLIKSTNNTFVPANISKGEIGKVDINPVTGLGVYVPLYCHKDFAFDIEWQTEGFCFAESEKIKRNYWTDDLNPPKVLNYANPVFTTYFASGSLAFNTAYMVVQGTINYLGTNYGPNEVDNVFTTNNVTNTYTGVGLVIEYVPVGLLDWMPKYRLSGIRFNRWLTGGALQCGVYQVGYQLVGFDGVTTPFSFITKPVHVAKNFPASQMSDYQNYQGEDNTYNSQKGLEFLIENIDTDYTTIRVVAVRSTDYNIQQQPVLFFEGSITGANMTVPYYGNENLSQLTAEEVQQILIYIKRINTITPFKNRNTGGNWEGFVNLDFNLNSAVVDMAEYMCPTDSIGYTLPNVGGAGGNVPMPFVPFLGHSYANAAGVSNVNGILPLAWYEVSGDGITYNGNPYAVGDYFQGVFGAGGYTPNSGASVVYAVIRIQKYTGSYLNIRIQNDWYDGKGSLVDNHLRSNWRAETYRYGLLLYDLAGNPTFVRFLKDKTMPYQWNEPADLGPDGLPYGINGKLTEYNAGTQQTVLRHIGITVNNLDFNAIVTALQQATGDNTITLADLPLYFSGFSIVRAPRDKQIFAQGIMGPVMGSGGGNLNKNPSVSYTTWSNGGERVHQQYVLYSPDYQFELNQQPNPQEGDWLRIENYLQRTENFFIDSTNVPGYFVNQIMKWADYQPNTLTGTLLAAGTQPTSPNYSVKGTMVPIIPGRSAVVEPNADFNDFGSAVFHNWSQFSAFPHTGYVGVGGRTYFFSHNYAEGGPNLLYGFGNWGPDGNTQGPLDPNSPSVPPVVSVVRPKNNLYGGISDSAKANTKYEYSGHFQKMDAAFVAYLQGSAGIANGIQVFGGDAFITYIDLARMMDDSTNSHGTPDTIGLTDCYAVESNVNVHLRQGIHSAKDGPSSTNPTGGGVVYPLRPEQWVYNPAYSTDEATYFYPALPANIVFNNKFPYQAIYSLEKILGEFTDSFRKFLPANKKDVEGIGGEIINMRTKNEHLYYWQRYMIGILPVDERTAIPVGLGAPMVIGTGGVMDRYDSTDTFYGNQHQFGLAELPNGFAWYDGNRRAFCVLDAGQAKPLSVVLGMDTFFHNVVNGSGILLADRPVSGLGIASCYDSRFKKLTMVFKTTNNTETGTKAISYDVKNKQFLGEERYMPGLMIDVAERLYSCYPGRYFTIAGNVAYAVGRKLTEGVNNYVCILAYTSAPVPVQPSLDPTHWALTSVNNRFYVHNSNDIGKFYEVVEDENITLIFNPERQLTKVFDNYQFIGNDVFWDDIECSTIDQVATDIGIVPGVISEYEYQNKKWYGTIPLSATGRLVDMYMKFFAVKRNRLNGNPLVSTNKVLRLSSAIINFRETR